MKVKELKEKFDGKRRVIILCPGCRAAGIDAIHCLAVPSIHSFNEDFEKPTFSPSLMAPGTQVRCHSYVEDGMIRFLDDCTHPLKGQTVPLLDFELDAGREDCWVRSATE